MFANKGLLSRLLLLGFLIINSASMASPAKTVTISGVDPEEVQRLLTEEVAQGSVDDFLAACMSDKLWNVYISYSKELSAQQDDILLFLREHLKDREVGHFAVDFKPPKNDQYRILLSFHNQADQVSLKQDRFLTFRDKEGIRHYLDIEQDSISYKEATENSKPRIIIKKMPDFASPKMVYKMCCSFSFTDRSFARPFLKGLESLIYLEHRTGLPRKMMMGIAVPHDDDPQMDSLPSLFNLYPGKSTPFIFGSTRHKCSLCGENGHRAEVHDFFQGKKRAEAEGSKQEMGISKEQVIGNDAGQQASAAVSQAKRTAEKDAPEVSSAKKPKSGESSPIYSSLAFDKEHFALKTDLFYAAHDNIPQLSRFFAVSLLLQFCKMLQMAVSRFIYLQSVLMRCISCRLSMLLDQICKARIKLLLRIPSLSFQLGRLLRWSSLWPRILASPSMSLPGLVKPGSALCAASPGLEWRRRTSICPPMGMGRSCLSSRLPRRALRGGAWGQEALQRSEVTDRDLRYVPHLPDDHG